MNDLYHHGILGQKWGIRRGPPYPIEDKVLRKGTLLNSVSVYNSSREYLSNKKWLYNYNPNDKWDSSVYKGPFTYAKVSDGGRMLYEHRFEVVKDLTMPTKKERIDEFISLYKKDPVQMTSDLKRVQDDMRKRNEGSDIYNDKSDYDVKVKDLKSEDDYNKAYRIFTRAMRNAEEYKSAKEYAEIMSRKYDAMVDDEDQGKYNLVNDPVIIFRANEALKSIGSTSMVTVKEIRKNMTTVYKEISKKGGNMMA